MAFGALSVKSGGNGVKRGKKTATNSMACEQFNKCSYHTLGTRSGNSAPRPATLSREASAVAAIKGSRYSTGEGNSVRQTTTTTAVKQDGFVKVNYACCNPLLLVLHRIVHNTTQQSTTEWTRETPNIISNSICAPKPICYYPALYRSILSTKPPPASVESFRQTPVQFRPHPQSPSPPNADRITMQVGKVFK